MIGYGDSATNYDFYAYNSAGQVWNGSAFVAWNDANYASYRIAASQLGTSGRFVGTEPSGTAFYDMAVRGASLVLSTVVWSGDIASSSAPSASDVADAVRTELATELARIDVATSTRLADADYEAAPDAETIAETVWTYDGRTVEPDPGSGEWPVTVTVRDAEGNLLPNALVRIVQASWARQLYTNDNAQATFNLDNGAYTKHANKDGFTGPEPESFDVDGPGSETITLTAANSASEENPNTITVFLSLGKNGIPVDGQATWRYYETDAAPKILRLGIQNQYREETTVKAMPGEKFLRLTLIPSALLQGVGMDGRYLIEAGTAIPKGSTFLAVTDGEWIEPTPPED